MKRSLLIFIMTILVISMITSFMVVGCKDGSTEEVASVDEETEEAAVDEVTEEIAEEVEETEEVVAAEEELFVMSCCIWGLDQLKPYMWGGYLAEKYWQERGDNVKVEFAGPEGWDVDATLVALEASIAKNPAAILWIQLGIGEDDLLTEYYNNGGMVVGINGSAGNYPTTFNLGTDNFDFGVQQATKLIEILGEEFKVAAGLAPDLEVHRTRLMGAQSVFDEYDGIEFAGEIDQGVTMEEATANASAFITSHPEVDAYIGLVDNATAALGNALKELGFEPGDKTVIGGSKNTETLQHIEDGYIIASQEQSFIAEMFYSIAELHFIYNNVVSVSANDQEWNFLAAPKKSITSLPWITKDNLHLFRNQEPPEGFDEWIGG